MSRYTSGGMAAYVQKACHCRRGWMCNFCRRWLAPGNPKKRQQQIINEKITRLEGTPE